jgi:hypothetical protein
MTAADTTFIARDGLLHMRRGIHLSPLTAKGRPLRWSRQDSDVPAVARQMLIAALADPEPPEQLVRAFASEVVMALPLDGFELTTADVLAWVVDLGSSQRDDLREERRPQRLHGTEEDEDDEPPDPAREPVVEAGGGVAEGFEAAEAALIAHATHADAGGDPGRDAFASEAESDVAASVYGDADDAEPDDLEEESR